MKSPIRTPLFVLVLICLPATPSLAETTYISYAFGKVFKVTIADEAIDKSPAWKADADNPPLSAKKALRLATDLKNSLVKDSDEYKWKLKTLALEPATGLRWYWIATFEAEFRGFSTGLPNQLRLVVLMDGTAIKPVIGGDSE
jgi:hypothetical protein